MLIRMAPVEDAARHAGGTGRMAARMGGGMGGRIDGFVVRVCAAKLAARGFAAKIWRHKTARIHVSSHEPICRLGTLLRIPRGEELYQTM